jgi:DNA-directed RNA polymerase subunit RPC12/RpoP
LNNFESKVTVDSSEVGIICLKCKTKITVSPQQLRNEETCSCPQCGSIHQIAPLRKSLQDVLEGKGQNVRSYTSEFTITCPKCHTRITISDEQLQSEQTYSCPQCGAVGNMALWRKTMEDIREYRKSKYGFSGAGQEHMSVRTDELGGPESDPDYYYKRFQPLWKQFSFYFKFCFGILLPAMALIVFFGLNTVYFWYLFLPLIAIGLVVGIYLTYKVRCPRCDYYLLGARHRGFWPLTGRCPGCGVRLKDRLVSDRTVTIIRIALLILMIACLLGAFYRLLNPV